MLFLIYLLSLAASKEIDVDDGCGKTVKLTNLYDHLSIYSNRVTNKPCQIKINFPLNMLLVVSEMTTDPFTSENMYTVNFTDGLNKTMFVKHTSMSDLKFYPPSLTIDTLSDNWNFQATLMNNRFFETVKEHKIEKAGVHLLDTMEDGTCYVFNGDPGVNLTVFLPDHNRSNKQYSGLTTSYWGIFVFNGTDRNSPINKNITELNAIANFSEISICTEFGKYGSSRAIVYDSTVLQDLPSIFFITSSYVWKDNITLDAVKGPAILAAVEEINYSMNYFLHNFRYSDDIELHIYSQLPRKGLMNAKKIMKYDAEKLNSTDFINVHFNKTFVVIKGSISFSLKSIYQLDPNTFTKGLIRSDTRHYYSQHAYEDNGNWYNYTFKWWEEHSRNVTLEIMDVNDNMWAKLGDIFSIEKTYFKWSKEPQSIVARGVSITINERGTVDLEVTPAEKPVQDR